MRGTRIEHDVAFAWRCADLAGIELFRVPTSRVGMRKGSRLWLRRSEKIPNRDLSWRQWLVKLGDRGAGAELPGAGGGGTLSDDTLSYGFRTREAFDSMADDQVVVPHWFGDCDLLDSTSNNCKEVLRDWARSATTDNAQMVAAILLSACRCRRAGSAAWYQIFLITSGSL